MSQFGDAGTWPREINQATAEYIVLNALCEYFGGDALEEQRPDDPKVEEALNNMESLAYCLSNMSGWEGLLSAIDRRVEAIRNGMLMHKEKPEGRRVKVSLLNACSNEALGKPEATS